MSSFSDNRQNLGKLCANIMGIISAKIEAHANDVSLTRRANKGVTE